MEVIRHAAVGNYCNVKLCCEMSKLFDELLIVPIVMEHNGTLIAAVDDMVASVRIFDSKRTSHD